MGVAVLAWVLGAAPFIRHFAQSPLSESLEVGNLVNQLCDYLKANKTLIFDL